MLIALLARMTIVAGCCYAVATGNLVICAIMLGVYWFVMEMLAVNSIVTRYEAHLIPIRRPNDHN